MEKVEDWKKSILDKCDKLLQENLNTPFEEKYTFGNIKNVKDLKEYVSKTPEEEMIKNILPIILLRVVTDDSSENTFFFTTDKLDQTKLEESKDSYNNEYKFITKFCKEQKDKQNAIIKNALEGFQTDSKHTERYVAYEALGQLVEDNQANFKLLGGHIVVEPHQVISNDA